MLKNKNTASQIMLSDTFSFHMLIRVVYTSEEIRMWIRQTERNVEH